MDKELNVTDLTVNVLDRVGGRNPAGEGGKARNLKAKARLVEEDQPKEQVRASFCRSPFSFRGGSLDFCWPFSRHSLGTFLQWKPPSPNR